jgi:DNA topoisomerase IA
VGGAKGVASETVGTQATPSEHTATLQQQLALTSHMCSQLLYGQNNLIRAVCERLDRPEINAQVEDRMAMLQQYQLELEAYYQQLYASYSQVSQSSQLHGYAIWINDLYNLRTLVNRRLLFRGKTVGVPFEGFMG